MSDPTPTPGARLKAAREQRGLSAQKVADDMHLEAWVIEALEAGDYARIGPTVYSKGHLKKYATVLGLPLAEIMTDFEPQARAAPSHDTASIPVGSRHGTASSRGVSPGQAAASLAAAVLLIALVWWQPWHQRAAAPVGSAPAASAATEAPEQARAADLDAIDNPEGAPITAQDYAPRALSATGAGGGAVGQVIGTPVAGAAASAAALNGAPAGGAASAAAARTRLRLSFTSDTWVDVRDAQGNRAYAGNGSANTVKTIAGTAPLHVYLRSANGVQLEINGRAVAIGPQFFSGDVARFEAGADGVLRRDASRDASRDSAHAEPTPARPPG